MNEAPPLGWGIVGTGWITTLMIDALRATPGCTVETVMSRSHARARETAHRYAIPRHTSSLEDLLANNAVDAVYIASKNEHHAPQAIAAARAGKHVLCEKPLGLSVAESRAIVEACADAGVQLATNHQMRSASTLRAMREIVRAGRIGKPLSGRVSLAISLPAQMQTWRLDGPGAGVEHDLTVHTVDALRFVLDDEVERVVAMEARQGLVSDGAADCVMSVLRFRGGTLVSTHDAFTVKDAPTLLEIHGTAASLFGRDVLGNRAFGSVVLRMGGVEEQVDVGPAHDLYVDTTSAFATSIAGVGSPRCTGVDGLRAVAAAEAIATAARTGTETAVENPWPCGGHIE